MVVESKDSHVTEKKCLHATARWRVIPFRSVHTARAAWHGWDIDAWGISYCCMGNAKWYKVGFHVPRVGNQRVRAAIMSLGVPDAD